MGKNPIKGNYTHREESLKVSTIIHIQTCSAKLCDKKENVLGFVQHINIYMCHFEPFTNIFTLCRNNLLY